MDLETQNQQTNGNPGGSDQPTAPQITPPQYAQEIPGKTLGIVAFILSLLGFGLISLVMGIIALVQSKKAGRKNGFALAAIIISSIAFVVIGAIILLTVVLAGYSNVQSQARCNEQGPGTHVVDGVTYVCDENSKPLSTSVQ